MSKARNLSDLLDANGDVKQGNLDNVTSYTKSSSDPATNTNGSAGDIWVNHSTNKIYICTDATTNANLWKNVSDATDAIYPNTAPSNPSNTASFPSSKNNGETFTFTFSGATDSDSQYSDSVTHYLVDNISSASLTVSTAEVAAGSAHSFTVGNIASDVSGVTFRVRAKDSNGAYSSGVTVTINLIAALYVTATGGTVTTDGDYRIHTFTSSGTFTVSDSGNTQGSNTLECCLIAGGGSGGSDNQGGGGGGGGGFLYQSSISPSVTSYSVVIGAGGASGGDTDGGTQGPGYPGTNTTGFGYTAIGGGEGAGSNKWRVNGAGGSGGGGTSSMGGGSGTTGQGYAGGSANAYNAGGGGGANGAGGSTGGAGGAGKPNPITGSTAGASGYFSGGGGAATDGSATGAGGIGGGTSGVNNSAASASSPANSGGGSGGTENARGGLGGSGIVVIRYKFQN